MSKRFITFAAATLLLSAASMSRAATVEELERKVQELDSQVKSLKTADTRRDEEDARQHSYLKRLYEKSSLGGYGELDYIFKDENGNGKGGNTFDPHRFVLYVKSELADWIELNAELEWEHGGDSSTNSEISVEQSFLDFKLADAFNVRTGIMLVPLGATNPYHEPTNFNSTERPELDKFLIPSTWREMGIAAHGKIGTRADYQIMVLNGLDGSKFSGADGIRKGRQSVDQDNNRNKAIAGRLEIRPMERLQTNLSFYTANSGAKGKASAYTTIAAFDGKYSIGDFDLAGEYVQIYQHNPGSLSKEIGHTMSGYWVEGAYHFMPKAWKSGKLGEADALLFARYSEFDTQQGNIADPSKASGRFDRNYTTLGLVFKPTTTVAIKADYQFFDDKRKAGETALDNNKFQVTLGFVF